MVDRLKGVRWGPGREIGVEVCEKMLALYDKFASCPQVVEVIRNAQNSLGRASPFEDCVSFSIVVHVHVWW